MTGQFEPRFCRCPTRPFWLAGDATRCCWRSRQVPRLSVEPSREATRSWLSPADCRSVPISRTATGQSNEQSSTGSAITLGVALDVGDCDVRPARPYAQGAEGVYAISQDLAPRWLHDEAILGLFAPLREYRQCRDASEADGRSSAFGGRGPLHDHHRPAIRAHPGLRRENSAIDRAFALPDGAFLDAGRAKTLSY